MKPTVSVTARALTLAEIDFARQRVERGEEPVLDDDLVLRRRAPRRMLDLPALV